CHTVSGLASISISRTTEVVSVALSMLLPLLSFGLALERVEAVAPEIVEKRLQLGETLWSRAVEAPRAVASFVHEPGLLEDLQVLRDRGLAHFEVRGDLARRELGVPDEAQHPPAVGLGDRLQRSLHRGDLSKDLYKCQLN